MNKENNVLHKGKGLNTVSYLTYAMLASTVMMWGGSSVVGKFLSRDLPPFTVGGIRIALATVVLFLFLMWQKRLTFPHRRDWPLLLALGVLGIFGCNAIFHKALEYTAATNVALIAAGSPIFITLFSAVLLRERILRVQIVGIILSFLGVVVVITRGAWSVLINLDFNVGDLIMLGNPIFWALTTVLTKKVVERYSPLAVAAYASLVAAILFIPFSIYELTTLESGIHVSVVSFAALAYLGFLASSVGLIWWNQGIEKVGASRAGIFMNGAPVSSMLLSALFLGEKIVLSQIIGAAMVLTGVYLNSVRGQCQE